MQCKRNVTLIDKLFKFCIELSNERESCTRSSVVVNQAKFITEEQENLLWENGFLAWEDSLLYFGLGFWHSVCFEDRAGTPKLEVRKLSVMFRT